MPSILLHINNIGAMRQVVGHMDRAQIMNVAPRDTILHLLHRPILERFAGPGQKDIGGLTLRSDLEVGPDRLDRLAVERQLLLVAAFPGHAQRPALGFRTPALRW